MTPHDDPEPSPADFASLNGHRVETLEWTQPRRFARRWLLRGHEMPLAELWRPGPWRPGFLAVTRSGAWRIDRSFWTGLSIRREGDENPAVRIRSGWLGRARIERSEGEPLQWRRGGWGFRRRSIETVEHATLVRFHQHRGFLRHDGEITLEPSAAELPDLEALILAGWCLLLSPNRQHAH